MKGRFNAALAAAVLVVTIGSSAWMALPVAAAGRAAAPSRVPAPSRVSAEPLSPKLRSIPELSGGRTAQNAAMPQLTSSVSCNTAWNAVASPNVGGGRNVLNGMAAIAPNDVWAVGFGLTLHWDGSAWSRISILMRFSY